MYVIGSYSFFELIGMKSRMEECNSSEVTVSGNKLSRYISTMEGHVRFQLARKMPARLLIGSPTGGQAAHFQGSAARRTGGPGGRASTSFEIVCWSSCFFDAFPLSPSCHRLARLAAALSFNSSFPTILSASRYADLPSSDTKSSLTPRLFSASDRHLTRLATSERRSSTGNQICEITIRGSLRASLKGRVLNWTLSQPTKCNTSWPCARSTIII